MTATTTRPFQVGDRVKLREDKHGRHTTWGIVTRTSNRGITVRFNDNAPTMESMPIHPNDLTLVEPASPTTPEPESRYGFTVGQRVSFRLYLNDKKAHSLPGIVVGFPGIYISVRTDDFIEPVLVLPDAIDRPTSFERSFLITVTTAHQHQRPYEIALVDIGAPDGWTYQDINEGTSGSLSNMLRQATDQIMERLLQTQDKEGTNDA